MATPDLEVIKEIPGYKVILKAVLKAQIQQLVEQLADHTDEESVILTANVSDGTLCHLGSESGKVFLNDHDDIKSQFLGFCLKRQHKKKQKEKEDAAQRSVPAAPPHPGPGYGARPRIGTSPRHQFSPTRFQTSPRQNIPQGPHPVSLTKATAQGGPVRSSPYPVSRPIRRPNTGGSRPPKPMRLPVASDNDTAEKRGPAIKIELNEDDLKNESEGSGAPTSSQTESSTSQITSSMPQPSESTAKDEITEPQSDSSSSTIPHEPSELTLPEGLGLHSDLSNLISDTAKPTSDMKFPSATPQSSGSGSAPPTPGASNVDPNVNIKVEAITESEMDLEITGVEPGWAQSVQSGMGGYNPTSGASGDQGDMPDDPSEQEYSKEAGMVCRICGKLLKNRSTLRRHEKIHNDMSSFTCCGKHFFSKSHLKRHMCHHHEATKEFVCYGPGCDNDSGCGKAFATQADLNRHIRRKTQQLNFLCNVCSKKFECILKLKDHMASHDGSKNHMCKICLRGFRFRNNLSRHMKSHRPV